MEESLADLPPTILSQILSNLPIKSLLVCRSVCKTFLDITSSNPYINSLHSSNRSQNLIIHLGYPFEPSTSVHLVNSDLDSAFESEENLKLKPMFQIPIYPGKYIGKHNVYVGGENNFALVGSCNGLLYFAERNLCERSFICNPVTKEYVTLPELNLKMKEQQQTMGMWFGFSPGENQYKVLRIFNSISGKHWEGGSLPRYWAQVHVVGRVLGERLKIGHLKVTLHGIHVLLSQMELFIGSADDRRDQNSYSFDFENEKFGEVRPT